MAAVDGRNVDRCYFCCGPRTGDSLANYKPACKQCYYDYAKKRRELDWQRVK